VNFEIKTEADLQQAIQIEGVKYGCQLMRNNSGAFKDATGRFVFFGLGNVSKKHSDKIKSSDLIGFHCLKVGGSYNHLAVIVAVEVKEPGWKFNPNDKREVAQKAFIDWINNHGGRAGFAQSIDDFKHIIGVA
jgi:hypothetical protein